MRRNRRFVSWLGFGLLSSSIYLWGQAGSGAGNPASPANANSSVPPAGSVPVAASAETAAAKSKDKKARKSKAAYNGPTALVVLPPTPMLDAEGEQRLDPDGKPMFNPPVQQLRDKKGHPVFDANGKPLFQTATNLGYDAKGKRIRVKKVKPPKMMPMSIHAGTLTVDGWTGKAHLNYDIADLKYLYIYAPGIGIAIVSPDTFAGAKEQQGAFNGKSLRFTVEGHPIELASDKLLLGKKPRPAWVAVDRDFKLPSEFPVFGYGSVTRAPYAWPGSKRNVEAPGPVEAPPLPADMQPALLLAPCPTGMMWPAAPAVLPGQNTVAQPCVPITPAVVPTSTASAKAANASTTK